MIISSRFPFPLDKGDKLRLYYQIKDLSKHFEIYLLSVTHEAIDPTHLEALKTYCTRINTFKIPTFSSYLNVAKSIFSNSKLPASCAYFYSRKVAKQIQSAMIEIEPDLIYCQLIRTASYIKQTHAKATLDLMDAFSYGARQRASNASIFNRWFWRREEKWIQSFEIRMKEMFRSMTIISELDKERVSYLDMPVHVVNNGIHQDFFVEDNHSDSPQFDAVFVGNMGYYPNIKAVEFINNEILDTYYSKFKTRFDVNIGGPNQSSISHCKHVHLTKSGWYDNVIDAYKSGTIFLAPLFEGIGQQNKILEAMAIGIPCVTSPDVCNALGLRDGEHLLVADDADGICMHINKLLVDKALRLKLQNNAKLYVKENFSWEKANTKLVRIIKGS